MTVAALAGVLLGAVLAAGFTLAFEHRRDRRAALGACRLLQMELESNRASFSATIDNQMWWPPELPPKNSAWLQMGPVLAQWLGRTLKDTVAWETVGIAYVQIEDLRAYAEALRATGTQRFDFVNDGPHVLRADQHADAALATLTEIVERLEKSGRWFRWGRRLLRAKRGGAS